MSVATQLKNAIQSKISQIPDGPQKKSILRLADAADDKEKAKAKKPAANPKVQKPDSQKSRRPKIRGVELSDHVTRIELDNLPTAAAEGEESLRSLVSRLIDYMKELDE